MRTLLVLGTLLVFAALAPGRAQQSESVRPEQELLTQPTFPKTVEPNGTVNLNSKLNLLDSTLDPEPQAYSRLFEKPPVQTLPGQPLVRSRSEVVCGMTVFYGDSRVDSGILMDPAPAEIDYTIRKLRRHGCTGAQIATPKK